MEGDNWEVSREIELLERSLLRLEERFRLEKESALEAGSMRALVALAERSRVFFSPEVERMARELARLSASISGELPYSGEVRGEAKRLGSLLARLRARFVSAPHRLLRNAETVTRVHGKRDGGEPGQAVRESVGGEDDDLVATDPPVECPVCGETLLRDKAFTLLHCPGCGATERL